jgi:hypothetical protein
MESNQWEDQLRNLLSEYNSLDTTSPLGTDPAALNSTLEDPTTSTPDQIQAWKRIEASLDAADQAFDETISQRVKHFHPQYDPHSWPILLKRLADTRYLRAKLIVLKSVEVAILLLLILSAVNIERMGKFPFKSNFLNTDYQYQAQPIPSGKNKTEDKESSKSTPTTALKNNSDFTQADQKQNSNTGNHSALFAENIDTKNNSTKIPANQSSAINSNTLTEISTSFSSPDELITTDQISSDRYNQKSFTEDIPTMTMNGLQISFEPSSIPAIEPSTNSYITEPIAASDLDALQRSAKKVPEPKFVEALDRTYTEFSVLAQIDYNALKMPEDRLYSSGREIVFPSKGIMSPGYGAGFTIAIGHPIWALETGLIYSAKDFEPGRQLIVGGAFDNGSVDFEAMRLQIVSLPVQYRYRFDHTGRFKAYAIAGGGFHVIAESDIDVSIKYHFASLAFGENPNNDPNLAATIQESRRIREHIRDGAPFSTKSFVSVNAGLGIEYMLTEHKALFLQAVGQYQIPNITFSNNNGKHLRSVSLQAGIRGPLGK